MDYSINNFALPLPFSAAGTSGTFYEGLLQPKSKTITQDLYLKGTSIYNP